MDDMVIGELRTYEPMEFGSLLLDVGANIGSVTRLAWERGAEVVAVEPDPDNAEQWRKNALLLDDRVRLIEAAVVPRIPEDLFGQHQTTTLYLASTGTHSTVIRSRERGVEVKAIAWADLLSLSPTSLKCDIEQGEYDLDWRSLPDSVRCIALELHRVCSAPTRIKAQRIVKQIEAQGFIRKFERPLVMKPSTWNWFLVWIR
jgi:FkbM family methyltransferase